MSKGLAFVAFARPEDALAAFEALNKKPFQGRLLHIIGAVDRNNSATVTTDHGGKPKSLKEQRGEKRRARAGKEFNWGMLYMNVSEGRIS
jgi:multiple RNA-binding domain-containing protein 1